MNFPGRLVIVSNRVPPELSGAGANRQKPVGGLVSAIYPTMQRRGGLWFGWGGKSSIPHQGPKSDSADSGPVKFASIDLTATEVERYYTGFSNRTLWPLCHSFPSRVSLEEEDFAAYRRVNHKFALNLLPHLSENDIIWVQDYHLIPLGRFLRGLGWKGRIGFFLHIPFPPADIFSILPWSKTLLEDFFFYDLAGFHTYSYRKNFVDSLMADLGGTYLHDTYYLGDKALNIGVYPIGIDFEKFYGWSKSNSTKKEAAKIRNFVGCEKIVLGVDRLDYTKGICDRLRIFERFLHRYPSWQGKVSLLMISSPSRSRIPEYINEKRDVDQLVGEINGEFAEADWTPITYLYRSYSQEELTAFYLASDVCLVTPLRDGMNLVAKEYIASRRDNPGVLILSKFTGAAEGLKEALVINPYDIEGTARTLREALGLSGRERKRRSEALAARVETDSAASWRDNFLKDLAAPAPEFPKNMNVTIDFPIEEIQTSPRFRYPNPVMYPDSKR
jgi:alpha,alpha-trehalose-phosphate synthase [UDP-forming]